MTSTEIEVHTSAQWNGQEHVWREYTARAGISGVHCDPRWVLALRDGLRLEACWVVAKQDERVVGLLPLTLVKSLLFGRFLVSLPYVNWAGVIAEEEPVARALIDRAVELADQWDVRYLELRHETEYEHPALTQKLTEKVHMRLPLESSEESVWKQLKQVVRTQIRKGEKGGLAIDWGRHELLRDFYRVFAHNMRDLGTPVYSRRLFSSILDQFPGDAELCVVRLEGRPIAAAVAIHSHGITEVPSASALRAYRATAANSLMYWRLVQRAIERGQSVFDFGRSTLGGNTYTFKKKWGARPEPAVWQYYVRKGDVGDMRPDNKKYDRMIRIWQRLPVCLTRVVGPAIVRGIP
ncbi:MAG: FemAB family PEP-CTERM system-associated protein [Pirellulales bacterium]|nr:FemAB family PEP-CTERM system-associated protein [Pirellulales bacterium]